MKKLLSLYYIMLCSIPLASSDFQSPVFSLSENYSGNTYHQKAIHYNKLETNVGIQCFESNRENIDLLQFVKNNFLTLYSKESTSLSTEETSTYIRIQQDHDAHQHSHEESDNSDHNKDTTNNNVHIEKTGSSHDHSHDHKEAFGIWNLIRFLGKFHPMVIHFPIVLLFVAGLSEFLFIISKNSLYRKFTFYTLDLAVLTTIAAVTIGWAAGSFADYSNPLANTFWYHKWFGTTTGILTMLSWYLSRTVRNDSKSKLTSIYRVVLFSSIILVSITGHLGAMMIYGWDHFVS